MVSKPSKVKRTKTLPNPEFHCQSRRLVSERSVGSNGLGELYTLGKKKGEGAYGVVQAAKARKTGMLAVVKTINKEELHEMELACIANELEILSYCDHPSIIRLFHTFEEDDVVHCAMQCCNGGDLADHLDTVGHFSVGETQTVMRQVLHGLHYLHNTIGVAHRDLKLENLLLKRPHTHNQDLRCKIIDFGFARGFKSGMNSFHTLCGTPGYLAPEIAKQHFPYNEKCDIFSCGVMLYQMLSGDLPWDYEGDSPRTGFPKEFYRGQLTFTGENWEHISGHAKLLAARMCRSDPQSRFSASDALSSEWLSNSLEDTSPKLCLTTKPAQDGLRTLAGSCQKTENPVWHLISEALQYVAYHVEDYDIESQLFEMFDGDKTGTLTKEEFGLLCRKLGMGEQESAESFQKIDADCDGRISFTEFLSGCIRGRKCSTVALLCAFYAFDRDHSGSITIDELKIALSSSKLTAPEIQRILDEVDRDRNGEVDFEEFKRVLPLEVSPSQREKSDRRVACTKYSTSDVELSDLIQDAQTIPL